MCHDLFTCCWGKANSRFFFINSTVVNKFGSIKFPYCRLFVGSSMLLILFYGKADTGLSWKSLLYKYYKHKNDKKNIPIIPHPNKSACFIFQFPCKSWFMWIHHFYILNIIFYHTEIKSLQPFLKSKWCSIKLK